MPWGSCIWLALQTQLESHRLRLGARLLLILLLRLPVRRAPTRGPRQARTRRRGWRAATIFPGLCFSFTRSLRVCSQGHLSMEVVLTTQRFEVRRLVRATGQRGSLAQCALSRTGDSALCPFGASNMWLCSTIAVRVELASRNSQRISQTSPVFFRIMPRMGRGGCTGRMEESIVTKAESTTGC